MSRTTKPQTKTTLRHYFLESKLLTKNSIDKNFAFE